MIHRIYSSLPTFKEVNFQPGLNVLLADKSPDASDRQTRNGSGKSSLVQIIHFLMAANCDKDSIFRNVKLADAVFGMDVDLSNSRVCVQRTGKKHNHVIVTGATDQWNISPKWEKKSAGSVLNLKNWCAVLGSLLFDLPYETEEEL